MGQAVAICVQSSVRASLVSVLLSPDKWPTWVQDVIFIASTVAFLFPLAVLWAARWRRKDTPGIHRTCLASSAMLFLFLNPVGQLFSVGVVDSAMRTRWVERANRGHLVGMAPDAVEAMFGTPCEKRSEAPAICGPDGCRAVGNPYVAWDYVPVPFFWMGHAEHFKVFFENGRVSSFKRGD